MAKAGCAETMKVLLVVCGGIAAYKACEVLRGLQKAGCEVRVACTAAAERFVGPATFEALTRYPVCDDLFGNPATDIPHIDYAEWADLGLVVPATANVMAKMAAGLADDAVSATLLACACPVLVAPGMNTHMWRNAATRANVRALESRGVRFVLPVEGRLACGDVGEGKLADVADVVRAALDLLSQGHPEQDLVCTRLLVTAGPTHEAIDPVRYIANSSTGKMGYAIAEAAARIMGAWERVKEEIMAKRIPLSRASREAERVTEAFGGPMADASAGLANVEAEALEAVDRLVVAAGGIEKASMAWSRLTGGMSIYEDAVWSSLWSGCKHVYRIDRRVADELAAQGMDGSVPAEALRRLPYPIVYIEARITIGLDDRELGAAGFVAYRSGGELELVALCDGGLRVALDVPLDGDERSLADVVDEQLGIDAE